MGNSSIRKRANAGFTLIEILVTLLVASIGLLGVAGLHSLSLRNNFDALMRSHASMLAADIADRMRGNRQVAIAGGYNVALGTAITAPTGAPIADVDRNAWQQSLSRALPNGQGSIAQDGTLVVITIEWGERGSGGEAARTMSFVTQTEI